MSLDSAIAELIIQIRASAEGVKQGVAVATAEFKKLQEEKTRLEKDLEIKIKSSGIETLRTQLKELLADKKETEREIRFPIDSLDVVNLRNEIKQLNQEKRILKKK